MNTPTRLCTTLLMAAFCGASAAAAQTLLGPANPTADSAQFESAGAEWFFGSNVNSWAEATDGGGFIENTGTFNLGATDTADGNADFRSATFSLGAAETVDFSFNFKFLETVATGDAIRVDLRFWSDEGGTDFQGEQNIFIGEAGNGDPNLIDVWQSFSQENIAVPETAAFADIRASVNNFTSWSSGGTQFDNFAVVPEPRTYALLGGILAFGAVLIRRRMARH